MGSRIGRPEPIWRPLLAYAAMVGVSLAAAALVIGLFWWRA